MRIISFIILFMNKDEKNKLLDPDSDISMMRWAVLKMTPVIKWMLIAVPVILLIESFITPHMIDWMGAAVYIAALGVFYTGLLGVKAIQKSNE